MKKVEEIANALAELGHPTRLEIHRFLVRKGEKGAIVSDIKHYLEVPSSTLSHHIAALVKVDLIKQQREGRKIICKTNYAYFLEILKYLKEECCQED